MNSKRKTPPVADSDVGGEVPTLDDGLFTEILLRLPAKSVTRFKLVCKRWLSIISTNQFRHLHTLHRHKPQPSLILRTRISEFLYFNPTINGKNSIIPCSFSVPNPKILSSCNGLMLLRCDNPQTDYYVYNPATKQSRKIILDCDDKFPRVMGLNLAFDPSKSPHYNIVCVKGSRPLHYKRSYQIVVYNSVSCTWKLCLESFTDSIKLNFSSGVLWNNSIYWKNDDHIMYFDIDKNVIGSLPPPKFPWLKWAEYQINELLSKYYFSQLQESNSHLYYFVIDRDGESVALWELQQGDDHSQWVLNFHDHPPPDLWKLQQMDPLFLNFLDLSRSRFGREYCTTVLRFIRGSDGEETTSTLMTYLPGKIRAYKFPGRNFEELVDLTNQPFYHDNHLEFDFSRSSSVWRKSSSGLINVIALKLGDIAVEIYVM